MRKHRGYWTKEKCHEEALKYKYVVDFINGSNGAFQKAHKQNWLSNICGHMIPSGNMIMRCIYSYEFSDNYAYVGLTYNMDKRIINRLKDKTDSVTMHINKTKITPIIKQLTDYIDVIDAIKMEEFYVNLYKDNGWFILNKVKTGSIGGSTIKWTYEKCQTEALKYNNLKDLKNTNRQLYDIIYQNKWNNELFKHMNIIKRIKWSYDSCYEIAKTCNNKKEFEHKNASAYHFAVKNNILNDMCNHMVILHGNKWTKELCHKYALQYNNKNDFRKNSYGAYNNARINNWLLDICDHMIKPIKY